MVSVICEVRHRKVFLPPSVLELKVIKKKINGGQKEIVSTQHIVKTDSRCANS